MAFYFWKQPLGFTYRSLRYLDDGHYEAVPKGRPHPDAEEVTLEVLKGRLLGGVGQHRRFRCRFHLVLRVGFAPVAIEQCFDTAFGNVFW